MALFCKAGREYFGRDDLMYNYSTDARDAMGTPKALFNCVASFQRPVTVTIRSISGLFFCTAS